MDKNKNTRTSLSSPEQLDDIIQVARPKAWLILCAVILIIIGAVVWGTFGVIQVTDKNDEIQTIHPIEFVIN